MIKRAYMPTHAEESSLLRHPTLHVIFSFSRAGGGLNGGKGHQQPIPMRTTTAYSAPGYFLLCLPCCLLRELLCRPRRLLGFPLSRCCRRPYKTATTKNSSSASPRSIVFMIYLVSPWFSRLLSPPSQLPMQGLYRLFYSP